MARFETTRDDVAAVFFFSIYERNVEMSDDVTQSILVHNVYFTLKDGTPANIKKLTDACHRYLKDHPGVVYFGAGPRVPDLDRPVNDRDFHVGLLVVFQSKKDHDAYQIAPTHLKFIEENKPTWEKVRVFDNYTRP